MKMFSRLAKFCRFAIILTFALVLCAIESEANTSPYVTMVTNTPLNQATSDTINGVLPYFVSHSEVEGAVSYLTDATSADTPTDNVILGPDNTWLGVAWDFGTPPDGLIWKLERVDAWISAGDNLRKGIQADLSVSQSGDPGDFAIIPNSKHWQGLSQNDQFNHIRWDFPDQFIAGVTNDMDRYPVNNFRYLRLNSRGDKAGTSTDWQTRFVEFDVWVTAIPSPETPVIHSVARDQSENVVFSWNALVGRTYVVDYKTNLLQPDWISLDPFIAESESASFTNNTAGETERYYRVVLKP